ncbi:MAG: arginase family protein, partial [Pseudomonadales bacterium]
AYPRVYPWDYDLRERYRVIDFGDAVGDRVGTGATEAMIEAQYQMAKHVFDADASLLVLGGDHTGPYGPMRAAAEKYGPISIVHFDAHQDAVPLEDDHINHGTFAWHLAKDGVIDDMRSAQLYIRTIAEDVSARDYHIYYANEALAMGPERLAAEVREVIGNHPTYVTFDVDGIDPSCTPGTGTPVWGGPSVLEARKVLWGLKGANIVAGDVVEVSPPFDSPNQMTAVAGATIALDMLYLMAEAREQRKQGKFSS